MSLSELRLPCGEYLPDQPDFHNQGISVAQNVVPRTVNSYSPMPSFAAAALTALASKPLGAFSAADASGNAANYVGTSAKLYAMTNATKPNFADRSGAAYVTATDGFWSFAEANGAIYATNGTDTVQTVAVAGPGNFANVADANTPKARFAAFIQPGFLLLGDINDPTVGIKPQGIRWSSLGDATAFPLVGGATAIASSSDWQNIAGPHGRMMGIAPNLTTCSAAIFFEQAVFKMIFTGTSTIFNITPVEQVRGTPSRRAITQVGQTAFFLAWNGFFAFDGTSAIPIGEGKVNKTFFADLDPNYISQVTACSDPVSGLCFWSYAGTGNTGGVPNRVLVYNPYINRWALITDTVGNNLFIARTIGTTLDGIDALGFNLDTLPYSLDSSLLTGGGLVLGGFDTIFKYGTFSGSNMAFTVDTSEVQLATGGRARAQFVRPIVEGDTCNAAIAGRQVLGSVASFGTAVSPDTNGNCAVRDESRYHRVRLTREAGNMVTHIQGAEVVFSRAGKR